MIRLDHYHEDVKDAGIDISSMPDHVKEVHKDFNDYYEFYNEDKDITTMLQNHVAILNNYKVKDKKEVEKKTKKTISSKKQADDKPKKATKATTKKTTAKKSAKTNVTTAKLVEAYTEEVRLIRRFNAAIGKERQRRSILNIYRDFERRAVERKVRETSPYAAIIKDIQKRLKKAIDAMDKNGYSHLTMEPANSSDKFWSEVAKIAKSTGLRSSATLLKRFVGIEGEIKPDTVKVERILHAFNTAIDKGKVCKNDIYWNEIQEAKKEMESYLKGNTDKISLSPQALNGLGGLGLGKPNAVAVDNGNGLNGEDDEETEHIIQFLLENAEKVEYVKFTTKAFRDLLRNCETPEGKLTMSKKEINYQLHKFTEEKKRVAFFKYLEPTLTNPLLIIKDKGDLLFIKSFVKGNKPFVVVITQTGDKNKLISAHLKSIKNVVEKIKQGKAIPPYNLYGIETNVSDSINRIDDLTLFEMVLPFTTTKERKKEQNTKNNLDGIEQPTEVVRYEVDITPQQKTEMPQQNTVVAPSSASVEPVKNEKQLTESVNQNTENSLFSRITEDFTDSSIDKITLPGDLGRFLGYVERYEYSILLRGEKGAGKTRLLYQLMNTFALAGFTVASFSLEIGKSSNIVRDMRNTYIHPTIADNIFIADQTPNGLKDIETAAKEFDVVCIDSWGKIGKTQPDDFDKLRKKYPKTMFVVIFQSTTNGTARGGSMPEYDAGIVIQVANGGRAYCEKNRYNGEDLTYLVFEQKLENKE